VELWPRRSARDRDATGREEEDDATQVPDEDKPQGLVCWTHKELAKLGHALLRWRGHWFDGKSSTELWQRRRENRGRETAKNGDGLGLKERPEAQGSHAGAFPMPA